MPVKSVNPILLLFVILFQFSCSRNEFVPIRETIDLSGTWQFALDTAGTGIEEKWFETKLNETVELPGSLDENNKGFINTNRNNTGGWSRERTYAGMAWYQKKIAIGEAWEDKEIFLTLERTKTSKVWVDDQYVGENTAFLYPQRYKLTNYLTPGEHTLTIMINNDLGLIHQKVRVTHAFSVQTNWNGIIGEILLEAVPKNYIQSVHVTPDTQNQQAKVYLKLINKGNAAIETKVTLCAASWNTATTHSVAEKSYKVTLHPGVNQVDLIYPIGTSLQCWSEFSPALYRLYIEMITPEGNDNQQVDFGMRTFAVSGTQFQINGLTTFLRGTHSSIAFPLTGYPSMKTADWQVVFRTARSYGINHYRFHSVTPPKAAFEAADIEGIYMQPELPLGYGVSPDDQSGFNEYMISMGINILQNYGNHASFVMFALGNELDGSAKSNEQSQKIVSLFRQQNPEMLYSYGSNNSSGRYGQAKNEDYFTTVSVGPGTYNNFSVHTRGSFAFCDVYDGGILNNRYPSTRLNFAEAISQCSVPVIGHEVGQFQIYPNYDEIKKYTGVLKPWNLEIFRQRLIDAGMGDQAYDFFKASGAASVLCYRADIEMALRTPGFGGFQLLDIQDYPGQGTALVGILDAFMDSKGLITPEQFSQFCNRVVPLLIADKFCWENAETFQAKIQVANFSERALPNQIVQWVLLDSAGKTIRSGSNSASLPQGKLTDASTVEFSFPEFNTAQKLTLRIMLKDTAYTNSYPLWIYPRMAAPAVAGDILISGNMDAKVMTMLESGGKVVLFPNHDDSNVATVGGLFTPDFWNYGMFKSLSERMKKPVSPGTLGLLINPEHPLFRSFPTEYHSNWQWWAIVKKSHPMILDHAPTGYKPLVQVIDNIQRSHKCGLIFEFSVGAGKILVCMSDLEAVQDKPEGRQLYRSILGYMNSDDFKPETKLTVQELRKLFSFAVSK